MKTFEDLKFEQLTNGFKAVMHFDNNYGISVIKLKTSFGFYQKFWEVAVLYRGEVTYNTDITNSVLIVQTEKEIAEIMQKVQNLTD